MASQRHVHGVGGEHPRAGAGPGAGGALDGVELLVGHLALGPLAHGLEGGGEVDLGAVGELARLHGAARDEHGGHVDAQRAHEHARDDLVAVGDADHGVERVGVHHRLDRVGDELAGGQAVEHARVAHGDAVVHADGVELEGHAARLADLVLHDLPVAGQVDVAGDDVDLAVADPDERLVEVGVDETRWRAAGCGGGPARTPS